MKWLLITLLLLAPMSVHAESNIYRGALDIMGIQFANEPIDEAVYQSTWEVFDKFNKGQKFDLTMEFKDRGFKCGNNSGNAVGCYHYDSKLIEIIGNPGDLKSYAFVLLHEYGHSTGIYDECLADAFARRYQMGFIYNCN